MRLFLGVELQGDGINAIAEAGRAWAIRKDVLEMSAAGTAQDFGPGHSVAAVLLGLDILARKGIVKAGPPGSRIELCIRVTQFVTAGHESIDAGFFGVVIFTRERTFRPLVPADFVLSGVSSFFHSASALWTLFFTPSLYFNLGAGCVRRRQRSGYPKKRPVAGPLFWFERVIRASVYGFGATLTVAPLNACSTELIHVQNEYVTVAGVPGRLPLSSLGEYLTEK